MTDQGINKIKTQKVAFDLRDSLGIEEPADLILDDVAEHLGIEVQKGYLANYEAYLLRYGNNGIIRLKTDSNPNRQRFSLAHEFGHWLPSSVFVPKILPNFRYGGLPQVQGGSRGKSFCYRASHT